MMSDDTTAETDQPKARRTGLLLVFVTVFIDLLGFGIVMPLLPRYGSHYNAGELTLGLLMSSFSAMQFLFAPLWGRVSDRVGRRPILILGLAGSCTSYALFGYASSLPPSSLWLGLTPLTWLFITRIAAGVAGATIPTAQAYIADVTGTRDRAKGMALIGAAFGIGFTFGPLLGAMFTPAELDAPPSPAAGYVASVLSGLAMLSAIFALPESLRPNSAPAERHWLDVRGLRRAVERPSIGILLATIFLTTFAFAQFESTLSLLTEQLGLADRDNFYVFAYIGFILTLSQGLLVRRLVPKVGEFRMSLAGTALMVVGLLAVGWAATQKSTGLLYAILPISVIGFSAVTPSLQALLSLRSAESEQGGILGVGQSMSAMARILGPVLGIYLIRQEGGLTWPYWTGAGLMAVGLLFVLTLKTAPPEAAPEST